MAGDKQVQRPGRTVTQKGINTFFYCFILTMNAGDQAFEAHLNDGQGERRRSYISSRSIVIAACAALRLCARSLVCTDMRGFDRATTRSLQGTTANEEKLGQMGCREQTRDRGKRDMQNRLWNVANINEFYTADSQNDAAEWKS